MEKPKYLYHYTNIDSAINIIKSGTWRLYEARSQSDPFEIVYSGNKALEILSKLIPLKNKYNEEQIKAMLSCLIFLSHYYCDMNNELVQNIQMIVNKLPQDNLFSQIDKFAKGRVLKFYISCFSNNYSNLHLWKEFANDGAGIVLQLKSDYLPENVGIKKVSYNDAETVEFINSACLTYNLEINPNNQISIMKQLTSSITDLALSFKRPFHENEEEYRIVICNDSELNCNQVFNENDREFINLPLRKTQLLKRIKRVYYTDKVEKNKLSEFITLLKKNEINSELMKI